MSWLNIDLKELDEQIKESEATSTGGLPKPNVYDLVVKKVYLDKTQSGTSFINFIFDFGDGSLIKIQGWDINRMFRNKDDNVKNSKGRFFNGVVLLDKLTRLLLNKRVNELTPTKEHLEVFNELKEVGSIKEMENKKVSVGIRHRIRYYEKDGKIKETTKLEIVDFCKVDDNECKEKLRKRIDKNPVLEDKKPEPKQQGVSDNDIPF